jgi:hypothetical protein
MDSGTTTIYCTKWNCFWFYTNGNNLGIPTRFSYNQSHLTARDQDSKEGSRTNRGYDFKTNIQEVSLGLSSIFDF